MDFSQQVRILVSTSAYTRAWLLVHEGYPRCDSSYRIMELGDRHGVTTNLIR